MTVSTMNFIKMFNSLSRAEQVMVRDQIISIPDNDGIMGIHYDEIDELLNEAEMSVKNGGIITANEIRKKYAKKD